MKNIPFTLPALLCLFLAGCAGREKIDPSFPITARQADRFLEQARYSRHALERPLIVVGGFHDFGVPASSLAKRFGAIFGKDRILAVSFGGCHTFDACRERLLSAVEARFPSADSRATVPVDVVAVSMGGLVSRYAARPGNYRRLAIRRLFTIATPHRGSRLALLPAFEPIQRDMRPGSAFLAELSRSRPGYEVFPYVRLRDEYVRLADAAPCGAAPWWVPYTGLASPHSTAYADARFSADIAARLLGLPPFSTYPPAVLQPIPPKPTHEPESEK